jgi:outer membrane protein
MKGFLKAAAFAGLLVATGAQAADLGAPANMGGYKDDVVYSWWNAGDIFVRLRGEAVLPDTKSTGGAPNLKANDTAIPEADISYFLTKNIAIETICCVSPHEITQNGAKIGDTTLFPPSVLLQYHFDMGKIKPYVGAGVNYTVFFDTKGSAAVNNSLKLDNAWGAVVQAGVDYHLTGNWFANVDFKKLWLGTDYSAANGSVKGHVDIDPIIVGAGIGYRFGTGYAPLK